MLWLSLHLPALPVEIFTRGGTPGAPLAVSDAHATHPRIIACDEAAIERGIRPGLALGAAHTLAGDLHVKPRDAPAEAAALERLAGWTYQYTSKVSLVPPRGLLLEIGASLALFGGREALRARLEHGLSELGYTAHIGVAPTPLGAWLIARAGVDRTVTDLDSLPQALAPLPLECLELDEDAHAACLGMGVRAVGDILRLPRDGLARRLGQGLVDRLDKALGRLPDPRASYEPPARFEASLELPAEITDTEALAFPLQRLLNELGGLLATRQSGVERLRIMLAHRRGSTPLRLGLAAPSRDPRHLLELGRAHLDRLALPEPVQAVGVVAEAFQPLAPRTLPLFGEDAWPAVTEARLLEKLQARLGPETVNGLHPVADHRPERAWQRCAPGTTRVEVAAPGPRPLWLLAKPRPLEARAGRPVMDGRLRLLCGPERIESGWWDGCDVQRDYFVAEKPNGARYWIFRERRGARGWYLHGLFS